MKTITVDLHVPEHSWDRPRITLRHDIVVGRSRIPAGFTSDMATTPRLLWSLFPPCGKWTASAIAHDYDLNQGMPRWYADDHFYRNLRRHDRVHPAVARLMYWAVRLYSGYRVLRSLVTNQSP